MAKKADWVVITRLGESRLFICRDCTKKGAIQHAENEADFEYNDDMGGDYVEVIQIKPKLPKAGECVEVDIDFSCD